MIEFMLLMLAILAYMAMTAAGNDELMVSAARAAGGERDPEYPAGCAGWALLLVALFGGAALLVSMIGGA